MDPYTAALHHNRQQNQGSWVHFEDGVDSKGNVQMEPVDPSGVHVGLPQPPRKTDYPPPDVTLANNVPQIPGLFTPPPQTAAELHDVNRVQRILDINPAAMDSVRLSPENETTIQTDEMENGKILTTLKATNERFEWIVPPIYHPELVPQKVVNFLQIPLEDYVMCLDVLVTDWRFRVYVILYKRIIGIWLFLTLVVLLALLFSGLRGLNLFVAGLLWLIAAGLGMCLCLYGKKKINDGLKMSVGHANKFLNKQRLMIGVDDRGKISLHKVVVIIMHYDVFPCLASIAQMLEQMKIVKPNGIPNGFDGIDLESQTTSPMDKAELLMLRCIQPYVKELSRKRLQLAHTRVEDLGVDDIRPSDVEGAPSHPKHCQTSWCLCQYVDRMVIRRKPRKWYQKVWDLDF